MLTLADVLKHKNDLLKEEHEGGVGKILNFHRACRIVIVHCNNEYARNYARAGLSLHDARSQQGQALYILSNISHWRGDLAKIVRDNLKRISKE